MREGRPLGIKRSGDLEIAKRTSFLKNSSKSRVGAVSRSTI